MLMPCHWFMTHGWPGSFAEFEAIIPRLTHPETFGGDSTDAFHVICPSIPGYGFSDAPDQPGFDPRSVAQDHILLMQQLGYQRYGLQGGDWGSAISSWHAKLAPDAVAGLHLNLIFAPQPKTLPTPWRESPMRRELDLLRVGFAWLMGPDIKLFRVLSLRL